MMSSTNFEPVLGIDLGTTNCCVATTNEQGKPNLLHDEKGNRTIPSYITMVNNSIIVGHDAKAQAVTNPYQTLFGVKRLIGRAHSSSEVQAAREYFPFTISPDEGGSVVLPLGDRNFHPHEVATELLRFIRESAEGQLEQPIRKAVITVPAYFNSLQRQYTKRAAELAGLEVVRLINEPTAAALVYGNNKNFEKTILVYDLGGGTFDVSILDIGNNIYEVIASSGDSYLGGIDFDNQLVEHLVTQFKEEHGEDLALDPSAMQRLKDGAERAKCELSYQKSAHVLLPAITKKANLDIHVDRATLERMVGMLVDRTFGMIDGALADAELTKDDIDDIILVGGQTRMPLIRSRIEAFLGKAPLHSVHPDEAVAVGAAIHGYCVVHSKPQETTAPVPAVAGESPAATVAKHEVADTTALLVDVTSHHLGIDSAGDVFTILINKNTTVPCSFNKVFTTTANAQKEVKIIVRQGDGQKASQNVVLGEFMLTGIREAERMEPQIDVEFRIDANGILHVSATDLDTESNQRIQINEFSTQNVD